MAGRASSVRALSVWFNDRRVGRWSVSERQGHSFRYDADWLHDALARPLSLAMPLAAGTRAFTGAVVERHFDQLLPSSPLQRLRLQLRAGTSSAGAFDLLAAFGRDCLGAASLLPDGDAPHDVQSVQGEALDASALAGMLDELLAAPDAPLPAGGLLRSVLPGRQPKLALLWHGGRWCRPLGATPTTHVLKRPLGAQPGATTPVGTSLENDWLCSRVLAAYGFESAASRIEILGGHKVLVTERFDRRWVDDRWWARLPVHTFQQGVPLARAAATAPLQLQGLLELLRGAEQAAQDRERLFVALVLGWMLAATDRTAAHLHLALRPGGAFGLAPLQGWMSAWPILGRAPKPASVARLRLALPPGGEATLHHDALTRKTWLSAARRLALGPELTTVIDGLAAWTEQAIAQVAAELPPGFPASVSEPVFAGLRRCAVALAP